MIMHITGYTLAGNHVWLHAEHGTKTLTADRKVPRGLFGDVSDRAVEAALGHMTKMLLDADPDNSDE